MFLQDARFIINLICVILQKIFDMRLHILSILILLISYQTYGQGINNQAIEIVNSLNNDYTAISGTQLSLKLPKSFIPSDRFVGYEDKISGASIIITEVAGEVRKNFVAFGRANLIQRGLLIEKEELYLINGFDALLQYGQQSAYGKMYRRWLLVIGDNEKTFLLNASSPAETSLDYGLTIKESLLSVIYQPSKIAKHEDLYDFSIDVSGTGLKKTNILANSMMYSDDGNFPPNTESRTVLIANRMKPTIAIGDKKEFSSQFLKIFPTKWPKNKTPEPKAINIAGLSGYEIYGVGVNPDNNNAQFVYHAILFKDEYYYVISGVSLKYFEENLEKFQKILQTFKLK